MNNPTDNAKTEVLIRDHIARNILFSDAGFPYPDDASFLREGIIDSLGVMELVEFVQKTLRTVVDQADVTPENFDSVARLAAFVRRKAAVFSSSS